MLPRTSACRSAAQHDVLRHALPIWITDNLLADAFNRFASVSNASRKRYGSNVPGPLEARRRSSKRRLMGLAAVGQGIGPDIGVLMGSGKPLNQSWNWQPPKKVEPSLGWNKPPPPPLPQVFACPDAASETAQPCDSDPVDDYRFRLAIISTASELESLWSEIGVDPAHKVLFSQMANTHFLGYPEAYGLGTVNLESHTNWRELLEFLRNPKLNVSEAQNITRVIDVKIQGGMEPPHLNQLIKVIGDSLKFGAMSRTELDKIMDSIPKLCAQVCPDSTVAEYWQFVAYFEVWRGMTSSTILPVGHFGTSIVRKLAKSLLVLDAPPSFRNTTKPSKIGPTGHTVSTMFRLEVYRCVWPTRDDAKSEDLAAHLASWVRQLAKLGRQGSGCTSDGLSLRVIFSMMRNMTAAKAQEVMAQTTHLLLPSANGESMNEETQNAIWLWFTCVSQTDHFQHPTTGHFDLLEPTTRVGRRMDPTLAIPYLKCFPYERLCQFWLRYWVPKYVAQDRGNTRFLKKIWTKNLQRAFNNRTKERSTSRNSLALFFFEAIMAIKDNQMSYKTALWKATDFLMVMGGPKAVRELCARLILANVPIVPRLAGAGISYLCERGAPQRALQLFKTLRNVRLSLCPELPLRLIERGRLPRDDLTALLQRPDPDANLRLSQGASCLAPTISEPRIDLVHQIALAYAQQTSVPTRHRFRNAYYCYLWLRDRRVPVRPPLSRALVLAGAVAPLENREWLPSSRLRWILGLVRTAEGPQVADQLDRLAWQWRGDVIAEVHARWDGAPGLRGRAGTVARARELGLLDREFPRRPPLAFRVMRVGGGGRDRSWRVCARARFWRAMRSCKEGRRGHRAWPRLEYRLGGKNGSYRPHSPWKTRGFQLY